MIVASFPEEEKEEYKEVKVLLKGNPKATQIQCRRCNSILEYTKNNLIKKEKIEEFSFSEKRCLRKVNVIKKFLTKYRCLVCPVCNTQNDLEVDIRYQIGERVCK